MFPTPFVSGPVTTPVNFSAVGDNVVVPLLVPTTGLKLGKTFINTININPELDVAVKFKAVNVDTSVERLLNEETLNANSGFIFENTSPNFAGLWELGPREELVIENLGATTVQCTGFINVSYYVA